MSKRRQGGRTAQRKRGSGPGPGVLLAVFAIVGGTGGALYFNATHHADAGVAPGGATARPSEPGATNAAGAGAAGDNGEAGTILPAPEVQAPSSAPGRRTLAVYQVVTDDDGSHLTKRLMPAGSDASTDASAAAALNAMAGIKRSPLPEGTRVRSVRVGDDGVATVDFNRAFKDNFPGGDEAEALAVDAVLATLGQFDGVQRVQILVEGQKIDSLGGTQSLEAPLPVPQTVAAGGATTPGDSGTAGAPADTTVARGEP